MEQSALWREIRDRFADLMTNGGADLAVCGTDLIAGSPKVRHNFRSTANGAGCAAGGTADTEYNRWLALLREKLQPVSKEYFSIHYHESRRLKPREIPLSRIDPPPKSKGSRWRKLRRADDTNPAPAALIEAMDRADLHMIVSPGKRGRYVVIPEHRAAYASYRALNRTSATCVMLTLGTLSEEWTEEHISRVCQASVELCELLEAEAFAQEHAQTQQPDLTRGEGKPAKPAIRALATKADRRAAVDAYIAEVFDRTNEKISRKDIWKSARYRTRSEFERWQRCAANTTKVAHERFARVLTEKPHLK